MAFTIDAVIDQLNDEMFAFEASGMTQGKYLHVFSEQMFSCLGRRIKFTFDAM
jgi:hypothetical protein